MKVSLKVAVGLLALFIACAPSAASETGVTVPGATVQKLAGGFSFTEGPADDGKGNVFFTDQPNDRILKWSVEGELTTFLHPSGRSNGLFFDQEGYLWACADEKNQLWRISPDGEVEVVVRDYQGKLLNGPNDVWVAPNGAVYFTDPLYKRPYWDRGAMEQQGEWVYYLSPDRQKLIPVIQDFEKPNGIIGTSDGKIVYVADIGANKTWAYDIQADGTLSGKRLFCELGSDGMTIDNEGNVYLTGRGVTVFDRTGKQIQQIPVEEPWTANVCFGGKNQDMLFITASKGLYGIQTRTRGVAPR
jgi:gluconolactonase